MSEHEEEVREIRERLAYVRDCADKTNFWEQYASLMSEVICLESRLAKLTPRLVIEKLVREES